MRDEKGPESRSRPKWLMAIGGVAILALPAIAFAMGIWPTETDGPPLPDEIPEEAYYLQRLDRLDANTPRGRVAMVGDSITERGDWQSQLPQCDVVDLGIEWDTTRGVLARLDAIERAGAEQVFILLGTNDFMRTNDTRAVFERYRQIVATLSRSAEVFVVSTPRRSEDQAEVNQRIGRLNEGLEEYCSTSGACSYLNLNAALSPRGFLEEKFTVDGVHFTAAAYDQWAAILARHLTCPADTDSAHPATAS